MLAILHMLGMFDTDIFKSHCRLEAENLFLPAHMIAAGVQIRGVRSSQERYFMRRPACPLWANIRHGDYQFVFANGRRFRRAFNEELRRWAEHSFLQGDHSDRAADDRHCDRQFVMNGCLTGKVNTASGRIAR